jgi:hypothetical protein
LFEKSKIIWHLTQIEIAADTDQRMREVVAEMAMKTGAMDRAVSYANENDDRALGAVYLVVSLCEMALEKNAPAQILDAMERLLTASFGVIEERRAESPLAAEILQDKMLAIEGVFFEREFASKVLNPTESEPVKGLGMPITGNMPDVTKRQPSRAFQSGRYLILFLKDVPPVAEQIGPNPMNLRFTYVLAVIDTESRQPAYFVTLESSMMGADYLGTIDSSGAHGNYGSVPSLRDERAFVDRALGFVRQHLAIDRIQEVKR